MTLQEVFDKVARHLLTQGQRSILRETGRCAYRGDEGCMCAVGVLIADEHYHPKLEDNSVGEWHVQQALRSSGIETDTKTLLVLAELQHIHDQRNLKEWRECLQALAVREGLDTSALTEEAAWSTS